MLGSGVFLFHIMLSSIYQVMGSIPGHDRAVFKTDSSGFPPLVLRIMVILLLACQCQDNGAAKYWLKK